MKTWRAFKPAFIFGTIIAYQKTLKTDDNDPNI